jgi:ABC-2 type transport system permease protein
MTMTASDIAVPGEFGMGRPRQGGAVWLLRLRLVLLRNTIEQAMSHRPLKLLGSAASIMLIWAGLYALLVETFEFVQRSVLEGIVATPVIFTFFFLALTGMLAFSNAILCYGALFRRPEIGYLLSGPVSPRDIVIVKYLESLALSSWSLVLLGFPLMMALARTYGESWTFYPLFLGLFMLFIPLPGALGLLLAWGVVMACPKTPKRAMTLTAILIVLIAAWWMKGFFAEPANSSEWLRHFYDRVGLVQNAMLPHTWVSKGIVHALQRQPAQAAYYMFVTLANSLFASAVAVAVVSRRFLPAYTLAQSGKSRGVGVSAVALAWVAELVFAYLPRTQRLLAAKDLKSFFRDPLQWSQMAILFGLLALYVSNAQRMWTDLADPRLRLLVAFLNSVAVSLILATFTSRFVFPLVSLEGQQFWLLGLLPLRRSRLITSKFLYALTLTLLTALTVMGTSVVRLDLPRPLAFVHLVSIASICVGLCGVSIGMGARMPVFQERNPARIAGGFGGTANLLISVILVVVSLAGLGIMSLRALEAGYGDILTHSMRLWLSGVVAFNAAAAAAALALGIRHFNRVEW